MSFLPLAHVRRVVAVQHNDALVLHVIGSAGGFDGTLEIVKSKTRIYPPLFNVFERSGNCGITGECPPDREVTATATFPGKFRQIQVRTAEGTLHPEVHPALESPGPDAREAALNADETSPAFRDEYGWWAWENAMPGPGAKTLHVHGRMMMPTPGYKLHLAKATPQGINPGILLLDLKVTAPSGIVNQMLSPAEVGYDEQFADHRYSNVHIKGTDITVPVRITW